MNRNNCLKRLQPYGISEIDFENCKKELTNKFGQEANDFDVTWRLFNTIIHKSLESGDFNKLQMVYYDMALFLNETGKDCYNVLVSHHKFVLQEYRKEGYKDICIVSENGCDSCQKLDGKTYSIKDALNQNLLSCKDCSYQLFPDKKPFCRCSYDVVGDLPVDKISQEDETRLKNLSPQKKKFLIKALRKFSKDLKK